MLFKITKLIYWKIPILQQFKNLEPCSLAEKCLSEWLVYKAQVDWLDINQIKNHYGTCKKNFKEQSIQLLLEIKVKKKYRILKVYLGVEK